MWMLFAIIFVTFLYMVLKHYYSYWDREGFPNIKPAIPFGNLKSLVKKERSFGTAIYDLYNKTKEPFIGVYLFFRPALLIRDADLIRNVLVNDFQHFHDRGVYCDQKNDPMSANLFSLPGEEWKTLRHKLTPAFTSGKLKNMFPTILDVGKELKKFVGPHAAKGDIVEMKTLLNRFVVDVLASVAFGLEVNTIENPNHEFATVGRRLNDKSFISAMRGAAIFICPKLLKIIGAKGLPKYMREFCLKLVTETIERREANFIVRKDLIQYLIQLRNNSNTNGLDDWNITSTNESKKSMSIEQIAAQVFIFYIAGSETSSSTIAYTLYELTQNSELMKRAQQDIKITLEKHNGEITYDSINDMKFIDSCVMETNRKYPGLPILNRECTKEYQIPGTNYIVKEGTAIIISLLGIHRDAQYFSKPESYDPDRFSQDRHDYDERVYIPFGDGPRSCIAFRMGRLVSKVGIVMLLSGFEFEAQEVRELEFDHSTVGLLPKGGINLKVSAKK